MFPPDTKSSGAATRRPRRTKLVLMALALGWLAMIGFQLLRARSDALSALSAAEAAVASTRQEGLVSQGTLSKLGEAQTGFERAHGHVRSWPLVPLRALPLLRNQVRSLDLLTGSAGEVVALATDTVLDVQALVQTDHAAGAQRVALLRRLSEVTAATERRLAAVDLGGDRWVIPPLAGTRRDLAARVGDLRGALQRASQGTGVVAELLAGPRRYLVLAANNAEMRAGSGMFLSAAVLESREGDLELSAFRPTADLRLPSGLVPLEGDLARTWAWFQPNQEWRNLGVSPRFDVTAPLAARMWEAAGGGPVDGVLAVDPLVVRAVLAAVGPVDVDGRMITAEGVVDWVVHGQYVEYTGDGDDSARREEAGRMAAAAITALEERDWRFDRLAAELAQVASGRHLLAWSALPSEQQVWETAGIDGSLSEDSLSVAVINRGGNKLDPFLRVSADLEVEPSAGRQRAVLRLRLRNVVPTGQPAYVAGPHPESGVGEGVYLGIVAVSVPGPTGDARMEPGDPVVGGPDGPTRVVGSVVSLGRGEEAEMVVRFELPRQGRTLQVEASGRVPAVTWNYEGRQWEDTVARRVTW